MIVKKAAFEKAAFLLLGKGKSLVIFSRMIGRSITINLTLILHKFCNCMAMTPISGLNIRYNIEFLQKQFRSFTKAKMG